MSDTPVSRDDTPTKPTPRPYVLALENGLKRVRTNSVEYDALLAGGYILIEQDGQDSLLRLARRASDRQATSADIIRYRGIERGVLQQIAAELTAAGHPIDATQLRWAMDEFRARVMRETGRARTVVSGRLR